MHDVACDISLALENQAVSPDRAARSSILHVSGTPFLKRKQAGYMGDSIRSSLCPFQLCRLGRRLECAWSTVLGQGGYAKVFYGQVRACVTFESSDCGRADEQKRAGKGSRSDNGARGLQVLPFRVEVAGNMTLAWRAMRPLLAPLVQASSMLAYQPLHSLTLASRDCAALVWQIMVKTAAIWGLARPCAVKVLQDRSPNKGAYGSRSVEHEVCDSLCACCACRTLQSRCCSLHSI